MSEIEAEPIEETNIIEAPEDSEELTPEQCEAAIAEASRLVSTEAEINFPCNVMVASRNLYWMARFALQRKLESATTVPGVEKALVMAMAEKGDDLRFRSEDVAEKVQQIVLPFLHHELELEQLAADEREQNAREAEEQARKETPLPLSVMDGGVRRSRSLVIVTDDRDLLEEQYNAVMDEVRAINAKPKAQHLCVLHILDCVKPNILHRADEAGQQYYESIGLNQAAGAANSANQLGKVVTPWLRRMYRNRVDLLWVDSLPKLYTGGFSGRSDAANAESAHRVLRKWADSMNCAVIGGIVIDRKDESTQRSALERLNKFVDMVYLWKETNNEEGCNGSTGGGGTDPCQSPDGEA